MNEDENETEKLKALLRSLTDRQKRVFQAFVSNREHSTTIAVRTGLTLLEIEATLDELSELGLLAEVQPAVTFCHTDE